MKRYRRRDLDCIGANGEPDCEYFCKDTCLENGVMQNGCTCYIPNQTGDHMLAKVPKVPQRYSVYDDKCESNHGKCPLWNKTIGCHHIGNEGVILYGRSCFFPDPLGAVVLWDNIKDLQWLDQKEGE